MHCHPFIEITEYFSLLNYDLIYTKYMQKNIDTKFVIYILTCEYVIVDCIIFMFIFSGWNLFS